MNIGSRSEIKKYLRHVFNYVEIADYSNAFDCSKKLRYAIKRYYISKGRDPNSLDEIISNLDYSLVYATNNHFKYEILIEILEKLTNCLKNPSGTPIDQLKEIYDEILDLYMHLNKEAVTGLLDCFDEIVEMREQIRQIGGSGWIYYCEALQHVSSCESILMRVYKVEKIPSSLLAEIENKFFGLFASLNGVMSPTHLELKDINKAYQSGIPLEELSYGTGQTEDDLRKMLQNIDLNQE